MQFSPHAYETTAFHLTNDINSNPQWFMTITASFLARQSKRHLTRMDSLAAPRLLSSHSQRPTSTKVSLLRDRILALSVQTVSNRIVSMSVLLVPSISIHPRSQNTHAPDRPKYQGENTTKGRSMAQFHSQSFAAGLRPLYCKRRARTIKRGKNSVDYSSYF